MINFEEIFYSIKKNNNFYQFRFDSGLQRSSLKRNVSQVSNAIICSITSKDVHCRFSMKVSIAMLGLFM